MLTQNEVALLEVVKRGTEGLLKVGPCDPTFLCPPFLFLPCQLQQQGPSACCASVPVKDTGPSAALAGLNAVHCNHDIHDAGRAAPEWHSSSCLPLCFKL